MQQSSSLEWVSHRLLNQASIRRQSFCSPQSNPQWSKVNVAYLTWAHTLTDCSRKRDAVPLAVASMYQWHHGTWARYGWWRLHVLHLHGMQRSRRKQVRLSMQCHVSTNGKQAGQGLQVYDEYIQVTWGIKIGKGAISPKSIRWEGNVWFTTDWSPRNMKRKDQTEIRLRF